LAEDLYTSQGKIPKGWTATEIDGHVVFKPPPGTAGQRKVMDTNDLDLKLLSPPGVDLHSVGYARYRSADDVNASFPPGYMPPYVPGTQVMEFVTDGSHTYVRVVSGTQPAGQWIMKAEDIEGLSPAQIAEKFALPDVPTGITSITPPAGIRIRVGLVNENSGHAGGGTQFQLLDRVETGWSDVKPLQ
jgi:hypothetical protein